jgi:hypothetical protein
VQAGPGQPVQFAWTLTLNGMGTVRLHAAVSGTLIGQPAPGPGANEPGRNWVSGAGDVDVTTPGVSRLTAWLTPSPLAITRGQWFALEVTVSNTGDLAALGVQPAVSPSGNASLVAFVRGPEPKKPLAIPANEFRVFRFTYSANGSGTVSFTVTVSGGSDITKPGALGVAAARTVTSAGVMIREAVASTTTWAAATRLRLFPPPPPPPVEPPFMSFEDPRDLAWETDGYVRLALASTRFTDGAHAAEITCSVPGDFTLSPTGDFRPTLRRTWPARGAAAPLAPRDWTPYTAMKSDWFNGAAQPVTLHVTLIDVRGNRHDELRTLAAGSATTVTVSLRAVRDSQVDLAALTALEFGVDTAALTTRPVLYLDQLRFVLPPPPPAPPVTRTVTGAALTRSATGRPAKP